MKRSFRLLLNKLKVPGFILLFQVYPISVWQFIGTSCYSLVDAHVAVNEVHLRIVFAVINNLNMVNWSSSQSTKRGKLIFRSVIINLVKIIKWESCEGVLMNKDVCGSRVLILIASEHKNLLF